MVDVNYVVALGPFLLGWGDPCILLGETLMTPLSYRFTGPAFAGRPSSFGWAGGR